MKIRANDFVKTIRQSTEQFHSVVKVIWIADNVISTSHGTFAADSLKNTVNPDVVIVGIAPKVIANWCDREVE